MSEATNRKLIRRRYKKKQIRINKRFKRQFESLIFYPCFYCQRAFLISELTVEHIMPKCLGGTNEPANLTLACLECNQERGREAWFFKRKENRLKYGS